MTDDVPFRTISEHARALAAGEYSALELTDLFLGRIERLSPVFNSFLIVAPEAAREEARRADAARVRGEAGPLLGIPLALKDNYCTAGLRTTAGSRVLEDFVPGEDAAAVAMLRAAGAVILGKTHLSEFASGPNVFGAMLNPWDAAHFAGGSSGGTASAVAAGLAAAGTGTDTGGSIRIPSSFCGLTGLKPTYGRVSIRGIVPAAWTLDHAGPMARSAEDAAALLNAMAGADPDDVTWRPQPPEDFTRRIGRPLAGLRVGRPVGRYFEDVDRSVRGPVEEAIRELGAAGCVVRDLEIPTADTTLDIHTVIMRIEVGAYQGARLRDREAPYNDVFRRRHLAAQLLSGEDYLLAQRARTGYCAAFRRALAEVDLLVTPAVRIAPPPAAADAYRIDGRPVDRTYALAGLTSPFNLAGLPALTLPCGFTDAGLPVGLQLAGKPWQEALLLQVGAAYQARTDWHRRWPNLEENKS
jgi:Asp-tRNA(Asn)/Glu-tRNA(Gln) amidotransferase A subunit family amidase